MAIASVSFAALFLVWWIAPVRSQESIEAKVFNEVGQTIEENFYNENFNGVDWATLQNKYQPQAIAASDRQQFAAVVNQMLGELRASHTRFYTPNETAYYQLLGIFQPQIEELPPAARALFPNGKYEYTGIGIFTRNSPINSPINSQDRTFISGVIDGGPAAIAGLKVGDQIISVEGNPYQPIGSFAGKAGQSVTVLIQRSPDPASQQEVKVTPKIFDAVTIFKDAQNASVQTIEQQNKHIGYLHIWSNAADFHQQDMIQELMFGKLSDVDGLVLDIRDGWGGGSIDYLNFFTGASPSVTSIQRDGDAFTPNYRWRKPVVLLTNEGSRSSKEIVAYGFQQSKVGAIVGTPTAGAVLAGRGFVMQDGSLLYVAVADVLLDGNQRLEGKGVSPDIPVAFPLEYAAGQDPQKQQAIDAVIAAIGRASM